MSQMRLLFCGSCRKDLFSADVNEDRWAYSKPLGTLALCDGASESFNSSVWAQILADKFALNPAVSPQWLSDAVTEYVSRHNFDAMSWSRQASYGRGSFSTLLGVRHDAEQSTLEVLAVGDSLAVLVDGLTSVLSWPFSEPEKFKERPTLFATLAEYNAFLSGSEFWAARKTHLDLAGMTMPRLVCVTDALGEWLLRDVQSGGDALEQLLAVSTEEGLVDLVVRERCAGRMRIDDSTLIVAAFDAGPESDAVPDI